MTSEILLSSQNSHEPVSSLFTRKELVGKGAYGGVYKGIHNATGLVVALKVIDLDTPDDDISEIQKEVALLSEMRDANKYNITLYHGCYLNGHELWIAMDFASGGSIRTLMKSGKIEEKYIVLIAREVLVALSFLHRQGIIHRDVKAANILLTQAGKILLCDFGVAAHLQTNNKRSTFIGTPLWMAPEVITDGKLYDTKADIWSLGVTLYEIATGNPPYFGMEPLRACALIPRSAPAKLEGGVWTGAFREFLSLCLVPEPDQRLSADELSRTRWIKSASKIPMALLRELIVRYLSWIQTGGQRASLAGMESLAREDTFELEEDIWDFDDHLDAPQVEPLGDEPPRSLDAMAAISSIRPPKTTYHSTHFSRNHPLLRLFDTVSNPYATSVPNTYNLPTGITSMETVRPMISIPSFEEMDEMAEAKTTRFVDLPNDLISPVTVRTNPFSWIPQNNRSASPLLSSPRSQLQPLPVESPWETNNYSIPSESSFPDLPPFPPSTSSPSLASLLASPDRPFLPARRRADTAPSFEYLPTSSETHSPLPTPSHSNNTSISSSNSFVMSSAGGSSYSSQTTYNSSPPPSQRPGFNRSRTNTIAEPPPPDANRPFRQRKASDLRTTGVESGRPRTASDSRPTPLHMKPGLKLQISTSSNLLPSNLNSARENSTSNYNLSPQAPLTAPIGNRYAGSYDSQSGPSSAFDFPTPIASIQTSSLSASVYNGGFPFPPLSSNANGLLESSSLSPLQQSSPPLPLPLANWPNSGPPMRSLDYAKLVTASDVHVELEKTIGELGEWLKVVGMEFERLLS